MFSCEDGSPFFTFSPHCPVWDWLVKHLPPLVIRMIKHFILNVTVVVLNKTSINHVLHDSSITRSSTMPPLPSTTMIKIIIHTTCLCHFVEGSTRDGAHSRQRDSFIKQGARRPLHACRGN